MSWLESLLPSQIRTNGHKHKKGVPEGLWSKCKACHAVLYQLDLERNLRVCPKCDHHQRLSARQRLSLFLDAELQLEIAPDLQPTDILSFKDSKRYTDRITAAQASSNEKEALVVIEGTVNGLPVVACAFNFFFMGGSMGAVVGEKFVQGVDLAIAKQIPFICFSASGGARMQEGLTSLFQMAKTSAALSRLGDSKIPYICVLTDPTMGGVSASLAMLGDIIIAEPKALIGFAGPRVIEQTVRETLPDGFQRSEFLLKHGQIDMILDRREHRERITSLLKKLNNQ